MKTPNKTRSSTRRRFLQTTALATAATTLGPAIGQAADGKKAKKPSPTFCTFIKPLQELSYDDAADKIAELGFDGIEATVRKGGHVLPERVEEDLPKLVAALEKRNLEITLMATDIKEVNALNEKVLRTAAALGVPRYRTSYYRYDLNRDLGEQLESFKAPLADLVSLNRDLGIQAVYQNHSGAPYCGAGLIDLYDLNGDSEEVCRTLGSLVQPIERLSVFLPNGAGEPDDRKGVETGGISEQLTQMIVVGRSHLVFNDHISTRSQILDQQIQ